MKFVLFAVFQTKLGVSQPDPLAPLLPAAELPPVELPAEAPLAPPMAGEPAPPGDPLAPVFPPSPVPPALAEEPAVGPTCEPVPALAPPELVLPALPLGAPLLPVALVPALFAPAELELELVLAGSEALQPPPASTAHTSPVNETATVIFRIITSSNGRLESPGSATAHQGMAGDSGVH